MTKNELESYCKSIGLVKSKSKSKRYYGFTYNSIYASPHDMIVAYDKRAHTIVCARYIFIPSDYCTINCAGLIEISDVKEIKSKINELIKMYRMKTVTLLKQRTFQRDKQSSCLL